MALVLKKWNIDSSRDRRGNFVHIVGRNAGLVSWFMSVIGIDSTSEVEAKDRVMIYKESSLGGFTRRVIPYGSVSSAYYGYHKPWKEALVIGLLLGPITLGLGVILALIFYFLNKQLAVGIVEHSGVVSGFAFKRSVIEGVKIDEHDAEQMIGVIRSLIEGNADKSRLAAQPDDAIAAPPPIAEPAPQRQQPYEESQPHPFSGDVEENSDADAAKELYDQARNLASAGQREQAITILMEIIDRFPMTAFAEKAKRTLEQA